MEGTKLVPAELQLAEWPSITNVDYFLVGITTQPARIYKIDNLTDQLLLFSMDGATNHWALPPNGFLLIDLATNKGTPNTAALPSGYGCYVIAPTSTLPTVGQVYFSYMFAQ